MAAKVPDHWTLVATPKAEELSVRRLAVRGKQPVTLTLPTGSQWRLSAELPGFWVRPLSFTANTPSGSRRPAIAVLDLWPLGTLRGIVKVTEKKAPLPEQILVTTVSAPKVLGRPVMPAGALACPVEREGPLQGHWSCRLPAGTLDLAISTPGFVPQYRWGVEVVALGESTLPVIQLERGASIAGWVAVDGGKIDPETCVARILPAADCRTDLRHALQNSAKAIEAKVGGDGFLQFPNVAPGEYALSVTQPGYAEATVSLIRVSPKEESFLDQPLILRAPVTLRLHIDPALDPYQRPWNVHVLTSANSAANGGRMSLLHNGPADREGRLVLADLSPGEIEVNIEDSQGNRTFTTGTHSWSLANSMTRHIEIPQVQIEGRITLGEEPLAATLWFDGRSGFWRSRLESDDEGRFAGILPRDGYWRVQVMAERPKLETWVTAQVDKPAKKAARVVLELPDTRLFGRFVNLQGVPVAGGTVTVLGEDTYATQQTTTDSSGQYEFRGLAEGQIAVVAETRSDCSSGRAFAALAEGMEVGPIELRCEEHKEVTGTVTGKRGPVGGVRVLLVSHGAKVGGGQAKTDAAGRFSIRLAADIERVVAHVAALGYGYKPMRVNLTGEPLHLRVEEGAGVIAIAEPAKQDALMALGLQIGIFREGLPVHTALSGFSNLPADGEEPGWFEYPNLAPGSFTACFLNPAATFGAPLTVADGFGCDTGVVKAGGRLILRPKPPALNGPVTGRSARQ